MYIHICGIIGVYYNRRFWGNTSCFCSMRYVIKALLSNCCGLKGFGDKYYCNSEISK